MDVLDASLKGVRRLQYYLFHVKHCLPDLDIDDKLLVFTGDLSPDISSAIVKFCDHLKPALFKDKVFFQRPQNDPMLQGKTSQVFDSESAMSFTEETKVSIGKKNYRIRNVLLHTADWLSSWYVEPLAEENWRAYEFAPEGDKGHRGAVHLKLLTDIANAEKKRGGGGEAESRDGPRKQSTAGGVGRSARSVAGISSTRVMSTQSAMSQGMASTMVPSMTATMSRSFNQNSMIQSGQSYSQSGAQKKGDSDTDSDDDSDTSDTESESTDEELKDALDNIKNALAKQLRKVLEREDYVIEKMQAESFYNLPRPGVMFGYYFLLCWTAVVGALALYRIFKYTNEGTYVQLMKFFNSNSWILVSFLIGALLFLWAISSMGG
ncbi:hypothetical protein BLNAU_3674 [Blattamonas nauphoetae]|uniref:Uncharacterized protein n=1 Tax=Blattamonas nauphoetae TaxID=2049346 RepID=A0ABQ9YBT6_9EUKA|nr:hypothetical protein BLNAU_3674 [Blattamonas nauphoetae]